MLAFFSRHIIKFLTRFSPIDAFSIDQQGNFVVGTTTKDPTAPFKIFVSDVPADALEYLVGVKKKVEIYNKKHNKVIPFPKKFSVIDE